MTASNARRVAYVVLGLIAIVSLYARVDLILSKDTYPLHRDEQHISKRAFQILASGDLNPHFFRYGSLPIYLTSASMGVGALIGMANGTLESIDDVTSVGYPYYSHTVVSLAPRMLFALISVLGLVLFGLLAARAFDHTALLVAAPLALIGSDLYLRSSWTYVNVDVLATVISIGALTHLMYTHDRRELLHRAIIPALFCGAVTATKYNSGVLGVPFVIAILLGPKDKRVEQLAWLFGLSLAFYALCSPYSFLDWQRFVSDIRYEANHYRTGHPGRDGEPGLAQLAYYRGVMVRDYTPYLVTFGLIGLVYGAWRKPRSTLLLCAFPVVMLLHMATNRVHFPRTVLPAFAIYAVFIGLGFVAVMEGARVAVERWRARRPDLLGRFGDRAPRMAQALTALLLLASLGPTGLASGAYASHTSAVDSRRLLTEWLREQAPAGCLLLLPAQVPFDPRPLQGHCDVRSFDLEDGAIDAMLTEELLAASWRPMLLAFPRWGFDEDRPAESQRAEAWATALNRFVKSEPLLVIGRDRVMVSSRSPTMGNPKLTVYRISGWK